MSWELHFGPIPDGMLVCHRCDNPPCVRPDHLFLADHAGNIADSTAKGRRAAGERNGMRTHPLIKRGELNGHATLTADQVREIRVRYAAGGVRQVDLATAFGVPQTQISRIVRGTAWGHVGD